MQCIEYTILIIRIYDYARKLLLSVRRNMGGNIFIKNT